MSALSANANSVTIVSESSDHAMVRLFLFQNTAGNLSSNLVVNVETLSYRTQYLTNDIAARFVPGDVLTGSISAASGTVCYNTDANTVMVTDISGNTAGFSVGDVLTGTREGSRGIGAEPSLATVGTVTNPPRLLSIDTITWSVQGPNAAVGLEFSNGSLETVMMLSGQGYYGKNELEAPIVTSLVDSDGNLYVSTYNVPAGGGYTITLSLRKVEGFASPPSY